MTTFIQNLVFVTESQYLFLQLGLVIVGISILYWYYINNIRPNLLKKFYVKQGFIDYDLNKKEFLKINAQTGDAFGYVRELVKKNPNIKGIVALSGKNVLVYLIDSQFLRELSQSQHVVKFKFPVEKDFNPHSMIRMEGEKHKRTRKLVSSVFHFEYVVSNIEVSTQVAMRKFKEWEDSGYIGNEYIDILKETGNFAGEVVSVLFFGMSNYGVKINGKRVTDLIGELLVKKEFVNRRIMNNSLLYIAYKLGLTEEFRSISQDIKAYHKFAKDIVAKKKKQLIETLSSTSSQKTEELPSSSRDLLTLLLKNQLEAKNNEDKLTDDEIMAQYLLFLNAGEDTTSHLITVCLYVLLQNPSYIQRIREEIKQNIADIDHLKHDEISKLTFLQAMLKESLRLYSPAFSVLNRIATIDFKFSDGTQIKKGTMVTGYLLANSWKEQNFADPNKFDPERWIENGEGNTLKDPFVYLPFWAGSRNCIGQHLAMLEARIFLIQTLSKYDMELIPNYDFKMTRRFLYEPQNYLKIKFTKLSKAQQKKELQRVHYIICI